MAYPGFEAPWLIPAHGNLEICLNEQSGCILLHLWVVGDKVAVIVVLVLVLVYLDYRGKEGSSNRFYDKVFISVNYFFFLL